MNRDDHARAVARDVTRLLQPTRVFEMHDVSENLSDGQSYRADSGDGYGDGDGGDGDGDGDGGGHGYGDGDGDGYGFGDGYSDGNGCSGKRFGEIKKVRRRKNAKK